jgi:hypothetical protein
MNIQPGDLIFYPVDGDWKHKIFAWMQKVGGQLGGYNGPTITHVAMVASEPDLVIEMKWPRPKLRLFADDMRDKIILRPKCDEVVIVRSIYWCYLNMDEHYSFFEMVLGRFGIANCHRVCSAWIAKSYQEAGFPLRTDDHLISPNELIMSDKLELVGGS